MSFRFTHPKVYKVHNMHNYTHVILDLYIEVTQHCIVCIVYMSTTGMIKTLRTLIILKKGVRFTDKIIVGL